MHSRCFAKTASSTAVLLRSAPRMSFSRIAAILPKAQPAASSFLGGSLHSSSARQIGTSTLVLAERVTGQVKWFDATKGFGFILPSDGSPDLFVHQTSIISNGFRSLADGEDVEFEVGTDDSGRTRALNVTGPDGEHVKGSPRPSSPYQGDERRQGGGGGGGFGGDF